jgi:GTP-binding protein
MNNPIITPFVMSALIGTNTSPLAGVDGKKLNSSMIRERLKDETLSDPSIKVNDTENPDTFELLLQKRSQLISLVEKMRQEGFELTVSTFLTLFKIDENNPPVLLEPYFEITIDAPAEFMGELNYELIGRQATMFEISEENNETYRAIYHVPFRFLIGFEQGFTKTTLGLGRLSTSFLKYDAVTATTWVENKKGRLISNETGTAVSSALLKLQDRGLMYIKPNDNVYAGMVVGENALNEDIGINTIKGAPLKNMKISGSDEASNLVSPRIMSFSEMTDYINQDECIEVTPMNLRIRKKNLNLSSRKEILRTTYKDFKIFKE